VLWLAVACGRSAPHDEGARWLDLDVTVTGCASVSENGTCEPPRDRRLRLCIRANGAPVSVTIDGQPAPVADGGRAGGDDPCAVRTVVVPEGARVLRVQAQIEGTRAWRDVAISTPPREPLLEETRALEKAGDLEKACAHLSEGLPSLGPRARARGEGTLARLLLARGRFEGAIEGFRRSIRSCLGAGQTSMAAEDALALSFTLALRVQRFDEASAVLDAAEAAGLGSPDARARMPYYRGLVAAETGELRDALRDFELARASAESLGMERSARAAATQHAETLATLGRTTDAIRELTELARSSKDESACDKAQRLVSLGWVHLLESEAQAHGRAPPEGRPSPATEAFLAAAEYLPDPCEDGFFSPNLWTDLAQAALDEGQVAESRRWLARARGVETAKDSLLVAWWLDLEGRLALLENRPEAALGSFTREAQEGRSSLSPAIAWRGALGRAEGLEALGRTDEAIGAYREAEALLDARSLSIPLGEGRAAFLTDRERSARLLTDALVREGRPAEAMRVARHARARIVRQLAWTAAMARSPKAERRAWEAAIGEYRRGRAELLRASEGRWSLPRDELLRATQSRRAEEGKLSAAFERTVSVLTRTGEAPPEDAEAPAGTLSLLFFPGRSDWLVFAGMGPRVVVQRAREPELARAIDSLLGEGDGLRGARRVRVLPYGAGRDVDVHAVLVSGAPLVARAAVEYAVDLPAGEGASAAGIFASPLVVGDPSRDLGAARLEAQEVAAAFGPVFPRVFSGPSATAAAVLDALPRASLFHYAGHGVSGGQDGVDSALLLAGGERMTVLDVLALPHVPKLAVLSSCSAGHVASDVGAEALGVAQAFVIAGAGAALAPTRPVSDELGASMSRAFYAQMAHGADPVEAARLAMLDLWREGSPLDWAAYRVVVP
jgi:tetratricopeptide (TPR) repeat protein